MDRIHELVRELLSRPHEISIDVMREELAIRDLIARYAYHLDRGDLDDVISFLTDDCVITSPRGTYAGKAEIRPYLEGMFRETQHRFHQWFNQVIRVTDGHQRGRAVSCYHAIAGPNAAVRTATGVIVDEVVKTRGQWRILARTVTVNLPSETSPTATATETSQRFGD